jgi:hypothetical protein
MFGKALLASVLFTASFAAMADTPVLDQREANQRERIMQGAKSGELTRPEAHRLARGEKRLNRHEAIAKADGVVSSGERKQLRHEARRMNKRIYRQKHDRQDRP